MRISDWSSDVCSFELYEIEDGVFTGEIVRPLCFGEGKVLAAEDLAAEHGLDLDQSFFYSDSDDDIELLERVGKTRQLNPNLTLKANADESGWTVQRSESRGTPSWGDYTHTNTATASHVGAFAAGLPIWAPARSPGEIGRASCRERGCQD